MTAVIDEHFNYLDHLELGGRSLSRVIYDITTKKVEFEFLNSMDNEQIVLRLERYECNEKEKIEGWKADFYKWERKHHGRISEQDYRERVVRETVQLLNSSFLLPDVDLLNAVKRQAAIELLDFWQIDGEYEVKLALLCDLAEYSDGFFCFQDTVAIEDYLEDNHKCLSAKDIDAFLRFKTMMCLCYERSHKKVDFVMLTDSRKKILDEVIRLIRKGNWLSPGSVESISHMIMCVLGAVPGVLTADDAVLSATLWRLFEQGKGDRLKVTMQNLIGYFISRKMLKDGSPAQNKDFFGNDEGYSNIDKGINENEMSNGFKAILPLLDKYLPVKS